MSVVEMIRRNDPRVTSVTFHLRTAACADVLLQAIQRNTNVRDFSIAGTNVAIGTLVSFLNNAATRLTHVNLNLQCTIHDTAHGGPALLAASLQGITNLQSLGLAENLQSEFLIAIFECLKRKQSLQTLALNTSICFSQPAVASFKELMRSTSNIRKLEICCEPEFRETFLEVVKTNFSLRTIINTPLFASDEFERGLRFYMDRNERMAQFIERPTSVPMNLRPEALHVASQAEPSVLFRSLLAIRGDLGTTKRTRKRKRPAYYKP